MLNQINGFIKNNQHRVVLSIHILNYKIGKVRKRHTGFNGPATGEKYKEFKQEFNTVIDNLLME